MDTGSPVSIIPIHVLKMVAPTVKISQTNTKVLGVTGHSLRILGECNCPISSSPKSAKVTIRFLVSNNSHAIMGLDGLRALDIKISLSTSISPNMEISECIQKCSKVTGGMKVPSIHLSVGDATPIFMKRRVLPYGLREPVKKVLNDLVHDGILQPVETSL